jgi:hypothetical protein
MGKGQGYGLHTLYSGLPSSTPSVQAELFYGVKGAVPAFSFTDRSSGQIFRMYDPSSAAAGSALFFLMRRSNWPTITPKKRFWGAFHSLASIMSLLTPVTVSVMGG